VLAELERARSVDANVTVESLVTLLEAFLWRKLGIDAAVVPEQRCAWLRALFS